MTHANIAPAYLPNCRYINANCISAGGEKYTMICHRIETHLFLTFAILAKELESSSENLDVPFERHFLSRHCQVSLFQESAITRRSWQGRVHSFVSRRLYRKTKENECHIFIFVMMITTYQHLRGNGLFLRVISPFRNIETKQPSYFKNLLQWSTSLTMAIAIPRKNIAMGNLYGS